MIIRNEKMAGQTCWLGDGLVSFDAEGVAVGVVKRDGRRCDPPAPLNDSQVENAREVAFAGFVVEEDAEGAVPAPQAPAQAPAPVPAPEPCEGPPAAAQEPVAAAAEEPDEAAVEDEAPDGPDLPDLDALKRPALLALVRELGIGVNGVGLKNTDLAEAIRAAWRERGLLAE